MPRVPKKEFQTLENCLAAVRINGNELPFIREDLRTPELIYEAVRTTGSAIGLIPKKNQTVELALLAVTNNPSSYLCLREDLQSDREIKRATIFSPEGRGGYMIKHFKEQDFDLCVEAVRQDSQVVKDIAFYGSPKRTSEEMSFLYREISKKGIYETLFFVPSSFQTHEMFYTKDKQLEGTSLVEVIKKFPDLFPYLNIKFQTKEMAKVAFKYERCLYKNIRGDLRTHQMKEDILMNGED